MVLAKVTRRSPPRCFGHQSHLTQRLLLYCRVTLRGISWKQPTPQMAFYGQRVNKNKKNNFLGEGEGGWGEGGVFSQGHSSGSRKPNQRDA